MCEPVSERGIGFPTSCFPDLSVLVLRPLPPLPFFLSPSLSLSPSVPISPLSLSVRTHRRPATDHTNVSQEIKSLENRAPFSSGYSQNSIRVTLRRSREPFLSAPTSLLGRRLSPQKPSAITPALLISVILAPLSIQHSLIQILLEATIINVAINMWITFINAYQVPISHQIR